MAHILANALVPVFVGLLLGYAARLRRAADNHNVGSLIAFLMTFALPASLFVTIARTPPLLLRSQVQAALVLAIVYTIVFAATYHTARRLGHTPAAPSAVLALTIGFPNTAAVGIPLLAAVFGPPAAVTAAVAVAVGAITVTPITLAILESDASTGTRSRAAVVRTSLWRAVTRPVFWAPVLGVVAVLADIHLPDALESSLTILGAATEGTALFVTGLIASAHRFDASWGVGWAVAAKNLLQPAPCVGVALALGVSQDQTRYLVLASALPSGFFGVLFGEGFAATPVVASSSLLASTVLGIVTLAGWIVLLSPAPGSP